MLRFVVQWFVSERRGRSYVPVAFWYLTCRRAMTFIYAVLRPPRYLHTGSGARAGDHTRNLVLIYRRRSRTASRHPRSDAEVARAGVGAMPNAD
jgi:lipid-A-disaccharide synthase-like uncharacterized protein